MIGASGEWSDGLNYALVCGYRQKPEKVKTLVFIFLTAKGNETGLDLNTLQSIALCLHSDCLEKKKSLDKENSRDKKNEMLEGARDRDAT